MRTDLTTLTTQDGRQLEYLVTGPAEGPALLFHSGMPSSAADFGWLTSPATALGLRTEFPLGELHPLDRDGHLSLTTQTDEMLANLLTLGAR